MSRTIIESAKNCLCFLLSNLFILHKLRGVEGCKLEINHNAKSKKSFLEYILITSQRPINYHIFQMHKKTYIVF